MNKTTAYQTERHLTEYQIGLVMKYNRNGGPARRAARHRNLIRCIRQLQDRGYGRCWDLHRLGRKEVNRLVHTWRMENLSRLIIAERVEDIRWLAEKLGRADQIPTDRELGIQEPRVDPGEPVNQSRELDHRKLCRLKVREQLITELQREFGLRTEEAIKFSHAWACQGSDPPSSIQLKGSWCKRGRPREIPVVTGRQRLLLRRVRIFQELQLPRKGLISMIPTHRRFRPYYREYREACHRLDIPGHALRHCWAQERFFSLSGIECPFDGGPEYSDLSPAEQHRWDHAAATVRQELGQEGGRPDFIGIFLGRR